MNNDADKTIRVGSRKSELALIQTKHVIALLQKLYPNKKFEIHTMSTIGDRVLNKSLPKIGEKSLFTRDLEDALSTGGVDFVVHSLKDLPTALPTGMAIGAVLEREDARDALVLRENFKQYKLQTLPPGCVIGTSSLRRTAQLRRQYPHLIVCDIRGNLNTRLAKLDAPDSKFSGIILAQAGLVRMGWQSRISQVLEPDHLLYAVGQGALAVECRANDTEILDMLRQLMCLPTTCRILAERSFLKTLGGGCSAPVAVVSKLNGHEQLFGCATSNDGDNEETQLELEGAVWSLNGDTEIREELACKLVAVNNKRGRNGNGLQTAPPSKRLRQLSTAENSEGDEDDVEDDEAASSGSGEGSSSNSASPKRRSPPVIDDDIEVGGLAGNYDLKELIEKHIDLAKKCPVVGQELKEKNDNCGGGGGGGDADNVLNANVTASTADQPQPGTSAAQHCPLQIDVGQDFMGQCPFVDNEAKVTLASVGKCPITGKDQTDRVEVNAATINKTEINKCPFNHKAMQAPAEPNANANGSSSSTSNIASSHAKCPFLQKTVEMFDYADDEKPMPQKLTKLIKEVDDLFCGLYQHRCHNRDLYVKSQRLGEQLAKSLISKGALEVMRAAQDEIHSKIS